MALELKLTDYCNLACDYCYYRAQRSQHKMSHAILRKSLNWYLAYERQHGLKDFSISFFGGEPLLCLDLIEEAIKHTSASIHSDEHIHWAICTNGILLSQEVTARLEAHNISIYLSLDGPQHIHDAHRKTPDDSGSHTQIMVNLAGRTNHIHAIELVISPDTAQELAASVAWLWDQGLKKIIAVPDFSAPWTRDSMSRLEAAYEDLAIEYRTRRHQGEGISFSLFDDKINLARSGHSYKDFCCNMGHHSFVVDTQGRIHPCTRFAADLPGKHFAIGHVDTGLDMHARDQYLHVHHQERPECTACILAPRCLANQCACLSYSLYGDLARVSPLVCTHERLLIRITDAIL